jgi:hypothetical protein
MLISERLGYSSVKITQDTYSHVLPNMQKKASKRLASQLFNSQNAVSVTKIVTTRELSSFIQKQKTVNPCIPRIYGFFTR